MRLIDADDLSVKVAESGHNNPHHRGDIRLNHRNEHDHFARMIYDAPTIDPETLRPKGRWIEHEWAEEENGLLISNFECSICHAWERKKSCYCPNCGAKMEV